MGGIWLHRLPDFLDKWGVRYSLADGWEDRARRSGGFDSIRGVQIHHDASTPSSSLAGATKYATQTAAARPIGNGTITRDKDGPRLVLWAAGASNTSGKGGPRLSSRGLIPLDTANSCVVSFEAQNNGRTEAWSDDMVALYVLVCCATLDWANTITPGAPLGPGDVHAHFEWSPGRKIDPAGPSRFNGDRPNVSWDMDAFRGAVFLRMIEGAPTTNAPQPKPGHEPATAHVVVAGDTWWGISRTLGYSIAELQQLNGSDLPVGKIIITPGTGQPHPDDLVPYAPGCPLPVIKPGDSGPAVSNLIDVLKFWRWYPQEHAGDVNDGQYGQRVVQGVANMQLALAVVGILGTYDAPTARAYSNHLYAMQGLSCPLPATSTLGSSGQDVRDLQAFLAQHGWYTLRIDGQYGPRTQQAVQLAQRHVKMLRYYDGPIHGVFDGATRDALCRSL